MLELLNAGLTEETLVALIECGYIMLYLRRRIVRVGSCRTAPRTRCRSLPLPDAVQALLNCHCDGR